MFPQFRIILVESNFTFLDGDRFLLFKLEIKQNRPVQSVAATELFGLELLLSFQLFFQYLSAFIFMVL